jgi:hypothetical protein
MSEENKQEFRRAQTNSPWGEALRTVQQALDPASEFNKRLQEDLRSVHHWNDRPVPKWVRDLLMPVVKKYDVKIRSFPLEKNAR